MTTAKKADAPKNAEAAEEEVQSRSDKEQEQGFVGIKVDPHPNEAYSLTTGPDSPSAVPDNQTRAGQTVLVDDPGTKHEVKEG